MLYNPPSLLQAHLVARVRTHAAARRQSLRQLSTAIQVAAYQQKIRGHLQRIFGPLPPRQTPAAEVTGAMDLGDHRLERVIIDSRPGFPLTASLYLPTTPGPHPAVLGTCGHANEGKAAPFYQTFARTLAIQGFVTLIIDPPGQGERSVYAHLPADQRPTGCVYEHVATAAHLALVGEYFGNWIVWDGLQGLNYLLSRPEVDPTRVGVTGNSGGGTLASYLTALDDRFTMAAPSCYLTTWQRNIENELLADSEQIPPGILAANLEMADFIIAYAPRPTILLGQHHDFFDRRGLEETFAQIQVIYKLLGAPPDALQLHIGPGTHGYHQDAREAMYRFFARHASLAASETGDANRERPLEILTPAQLQATEQGQAVHRPGSLTMDQYVGKKSAELLAHRPGMNPDALPVVLTELLKLPSRPATPYYRILRPFEPPCESAKPLKIAWHWAVETEPDMLAMLYAWQTDPGDGKASYIAPLPNLEEVTLLVPDYSSDEEIRASMIPEGGRWIHSVDVRGVGRMASHAAGDAYNSSEFGREFFYCMYSQMLGESFLGRQVHDLLCCLDLLAAQGARRVHLIGHGAGALHATFAACLHDTVHRVTLHQPLAAFTDLVSLPRFGCPVSLIPFGVLGQLDLPDCYAWLTTRKKLTKVGEVSGPAAATWPPPRPPIR